MLPLQQGQIYYCVCQQHKKMALVPTFWVVIDSGMGLVYLECMERPPKNVPFAVGC